MRKTLFFLIIGLSAAFARAQVSNLIPNGNLEIVSSDDSSLPAEWKSSAEGNDETGTKWTYTPAGGSDDAASVSIVTSGSHGVKQWHSGAFNIAPEQNYVVSFSYKTDVLNSYVRIDFWGDAAA